MSCYEYFLRRKGTPRIRIRCKIANNPIYSNKYKLIQKYFINEVIGDLRAEIFDALNALLERNSPQYGREIP